MSLFSDLISLRRDQKHAEEGVRLFYDGSIRTKTINGAGRIGWYVVAASVPGASPLIGRYFEVGPAEDRFLKVKNLRDALALRDKIITITVEDRIQRRNSTKLIKSKDSGWGTPIIKF